MNSPNRKPELSLAMISGLKAVWHFLEIKFFCNILRSYNVTKATEKTWWCRTPSRWLPIL